MNMIRIATRQSPLALWQAQTVAKQLQHAYPATTVTLVPLLTTGDRILDKPLVAMGGKGLFIKELEQALLEKKADIAVHSLKDLPATLDPAFTLAAVMARSDARDAFLSERYASLAALPAGASVGTASLRRQAQLLALRPDLVIKPLRGNLHTRLEKLASGLFDAIVLAAAGLKRLGLAHKITAYFSEEELIPAIGQGVIAIERLTDNTSLDLSILQDENTQLLIRAERTLNAILQGGCKTPLGGYATFINNDQLKLSALVAHPSGAPILRVALTGDKQQPEALGQRVAEALCAQGAQALLAHAYDK